MNAAHATKLISRFAESAFETLEALLGAKIAHTAGTPQSGADAQLTQWAATYPVWLHASVAGGGAVALLWTQEGIASLAARVGGEDPATKLSVSDDDSAALQELSESLLGGGAAALSDVLGSDCAIDAAAYRIGGDATALKSAVGDALVGAEVTYELDGEKGRALFVYSAKLEERMPGGAQEKDEPIVSKEEVQDILGGFSPDDDRDHSRKNGGPAPDNLDVVMDIELVATARLGKVEVPISEVLNYGPGSIIELGHVVDEPIELLVNGKLIARGDVVVVDERFGLRITEIISPRERIESLR